jgi:hypothetical protein
LIAAPFHAGLEKAFDFAAAACLVAALASWLSGGKYVHGSGEQAESGVVESVEAMGSSMMPLETVEEADADSDAHVEIESGKVLR